MILNSTWVCVRYPKTPFTFLAPTRSSRKANVRPFVSSYLRSVQVCLELLNFRQALSNLLAVSQLSLSFLPSSFSALSQLSFSSLAALSLSSLSQLSISALSQPFPQLSLSLLFSSLSALSQLSLLSLCSLSALSALSLLTLSSLHSLSALSVLSSFLSSAFSSSLTQLFLSSFS